MPGKRRKTSSSRRRRRSTVGGSTKRKSAQKQFQLPKPRKSTVKALSNLLETKKTTGVIPDQQYPTPPTGWIENPIYVHTMDYAITHKFLHVEPFLLMSYANDVSSQAPNQSNVNDLAAQCMEGDALFAKYLTMKIQVDYPEGGNAPDQAPRPLEVIWGWVNPMNLTAYTTPSATTVQPSAIRAHIENHVKEEFDHINDPLRFHDRKKRMYNVIGRKTITPNFNRQVPTMVTYLGAAGPIQLQLKWPMMKKVNYQKSARNPWAGDLGRAFAYPNEAYLPFVVVFNPDAHMYSETNEAGRPKVKYHSCMWYNDA